MSKHHYSFLALGDSYTIGESVALHESFPYQAVQLLRKAGMSFQAPEIVARTGWTSFELAEHMLHTSLNDQYDFVTLLVGVNNQYRGLSPDDFNSDLDFILKKAIHLSGERSDRVVLFSIPDWGVTPFASKKNRDKISHDIDRFNHTCEAASRKYKTQYLNITGDSRLAKNDTSLLAPDGLHYSQKAYEVWANKLASLVREGLKHDRPK